MITSKDKHSFVLLAMVKALYVEFTLFIITWVSAVSVPNEVKTFLFKPKIMESCSMYFST
jgi:hypothetical protein